MKQSDYQPVERRPIQSRDTAWARAVTGLLVRTRISPDAISILGMFAAIGAGAAFASTGFAEGILVRLLWILGGLLCQVRLLCNLFDGMVAVQRKIASSKGELYNEVPDRVSDAAVMIGLGYSIAGDPAFGFVAALVSVFVAYVRAAAKSMGAPNDFCGPMAKPQRMALATLAAFYLGLAPTAWRLAWGEVNVILAIVIAGGIVTAARRLRRAAKHLEGSAA